MQHFYKLKKKLPDLPIALFSLMIKTQWQPEKVSSILLLNFRLLFIIMGVFQENILYLVVNIVIMTHSKTVEHKSWLKKFKDKEPHSFLLNICPQPKSQYSFNVLFSNKVTKHSSQRYCNRALIRVFSLKVSIQEIFCKKCVLKISINSPENILAGVIFLMWLLVSGLQLH